MKIKTTLRNHFTLVGIAIIKNTTTTKFWQGCRAGGRNPCTLLVGM
jgi:hypothetical protein